MIQIKFITFKPTSLAMVITTTLGGIAAMSDTVAAEITVSPGDTRQLSGDMDHSGDTITMMGGDLFLKQGLQLGGTGNNFPGLSMSAGNLTMEAGAKMTGQALMKGVATARIGIGGSSSSPAVITNLSESDQASASLDNVHLSSGHPVFNGSTDATSVIYMEGQSKLTTTNRTVISGNSEQAGVTLVGKSSANLNGSTITSGTVGVFAEDQTLANLSGVSVITEGGGMVATGNTHFTISGSAITVNNTRTEGNGVGPLMDFDAFGAEIYGGNKTSAESPVLTLSDSTIVVKRGLKSTGLGLVASNLSHPIMTVNNSNIYADGFGAVFDQDPNGINPGTGVSTLNLNNSVIQAGHGDAIWVQKNTKAAINLSGKSTKLSAGSGKNTLKTDAGSNTTVMVNNADITGNVVNTGGNTKLTLGNAASWTGTFSGLTALTTQSGGEAVITGDSSITGNVSNNGAIAFSSGTTAGHILTIGGNYAGNGGTLQFNTVLGGDNSVTDKMIVNGNTSGSTNVVVSNAGGHGGRTLDGIELIQVKGVSDGIFTPLGRIVAGAYDYNLTKHGNNWYLNSYLTNPNPGPGPRPTPPINHIIRPEAGSYIANQAATSMFLTTLHERAGENRYLNSFSPDGEVSSLWLRQVGNHNQFRDTSEQLRTTGNTYVAQMGGDIAQWNSNDHDRYHLGIMTGYGNNKNSTYSRVSGHHSKGVVSGYSVGLYGTWYQNDADSTGMYVDGQLMYSWFNNHVSGDAVASESYKSKGLTASAETGYTMAMGQFGAQDNPTRVFLEPQVQATWMGVKSDGLTENNGTRVKIEGDNNVQTRLGARLFMQGHNRMDNGKGRTFEPFLEANWLHNTKRNGVRMDGVFLEQAGATNIGEMKVGVEGQLVKSVALWGSVGQQLGEKGYSNTNVMLGIKYSF